MINFTKIWDAVFDPHGTHARHGAHSSLMSSCLCFMRVRVQPVQMFGTMFLESDAQDPVEANKRVRLLHPDNEVLPPKKTRWCNCFNYEFQQEKITIGDAYNPTPYDGIYIQKNPDEFDLSFEHEHRNNGKPYELR